MQFDPNLALAWARLARADTLLYRARDDTHGTLVARADGAKRALKNAQRLEPNSPETLLAFGYYQYWILEDFGSAKATFGRVSKILPGSSEAPYALGRVMRAEGHWDQSIPYFEQALALDPRNVELLRATALTYAMLKQFPAALKLFDRLLDIKPSDPDLMAHKASIYQAEGNLQQAAMLLSGISEPSSWFPFSTKASQLQYEHNYGELIRLLQARLAQSRLDGQFEKARFQVRLASTQHCSGDTAGAKVTAQLARNTLEQLYRDQPGDYYSRFGSIPLCEAYAVMGENALALNQAQRAVRLYPRAKDPVDGPMYEESLAVVQTLIGENSRAIATITGLLRTPYESWNYKPTGITPALLRLDPIWDPLRGDPAFQKLCEEKQPPATP